MNEKEVIAFLKETKQTPSPDAVDRGINSLPDIQKPNRLLPLVRLQLRSMPASVYIWALTAVAFQIFLAVSLSPMDALMATGISSAIVALLFGWHLMLSRAGSMIEIEKCCKYSYGQIMLARILCLSSLTLAALLAAVIPSAGFSHMGITFMLAATLPTLIGALMALLWANHIGNSDFAQLTMYLVATLITSLMLEWIVEAGILLICAIQLITLTALVLQTKNLTNRRIDYEAYHY